MNELLEIYIASLDYPNVSGAEHLELLNIRDQIEEIVNTFSPREKRKLQEADRKMLTNMAGSKQVCVKRECGVYDR